jgi:hypothetical protein
MKENRWGLKSGTFYRGRSWLPTARETVRFLEEIREDEEGELRAIYIRYGKNGKGTRCESFLITFGQWMTREALPEEECPTCRKAVPSLFAHLPRCAESEHNQQP